MESKWVAPVRFSIRWFDDRDPSLTREEQKKRRLDLQHYTGWPNFERLEFEFSRIEKHYQKYMRRDKAHDFEELLVPRTRSQQDHVCNNC